MKTFCQTLFLSLLTLAGVALIASASPAPSLDVTVSTSAGKTVSKFRTDSQGNFTTPTLASGSYVVLFKSKQSLSGQYLLLIKAGKSDTSANVRAQKFSQGGVAMRIQVDKAVSLIGQAVDARSAAAVAAMKKASPTPSASATPRRGTANALVF